MEQGFETKVEKSRDQNQGSALKIGESWCHCLRKVITIRLFQRLDKAMIQFEHGVSVCTGTRWPQTEKEATPNITTQEVSLVVCMNPQRLDSWTVVQSHWPAQSLDLNLIENPWDQIKTMVQEQNPTSVKELWTAKNSAWEGFPSDRLNNLIVSVSRGCGDVIRARGGPAKY